jgi:hypothetical protein
VLRRPGETGAGQSSPPAQTASSGQEGKSGAQRTGVPTPTDEEPEQDPNRPVLRRGKPAPQKQTGTVAAAQRKPAAPAPPQVRTTQPSPTQPSAATTPAAAAQPEFLPAISDAAPTDTRNFAYQWTPPAPATDAASGDEQQRMTGALQAMASAEVRAFARAHGAAALGKSEVETGSKTGEAPQPAAPFPARRGARTRRPPASASTTNLTFHEVIVRGFDLDLSNAAVLVYSGAYRAVSNTYYVTVVARVDLNGEPRKLFSSVTNSAYLDSIPRLEVLDAVDADGDGRGELLFRQTWQAGQAFGLYRVGPDQMIRLFESAPRATS